MSDKIVYRDCINWSNNDHCAKTKCNYCTNNCKDYRKLKERPMPEKRNALAELAEEMQEDVRIMYAHVKIRERMKKAQRIVAELAKPDRVDGRIACEIMMNCRAIAEEGAEE